MRDQAIKHGGFVPRRIGRARAAVRRALGLDAAPATLREPDPPAAWGWLPALTLNAALGLVMAALAADASRAGSENAVAAFYATVALIVWPVVARATLPGLSRAERVGLVMMLTTALYGLRIVRAPAAFVDHDEFLHWRTALDILEQGRLFTPNALLPVSPLYPGLEIVTTALSQLSGVSLFWASVLVLFAARLTFMAALYLVFERISGSARAGSTACLFFMGASTFVFFDTHFSYESLAVTFLAVALLSEAGAAGSGPSRRVLVLTLPVLAALAATHHMTAYFVALLFCGHAALATLRRPPAPGLARTWAAAACALALPLAWSRLMGDPGSDYLGPVFEDGLAEVVRLVTDASGRTLFVSDDGTLAPIWQRVLALGSVALVGLGLATGFLRALVLAGLALPARRLPRPGNLLRYDDPWLVLMALLTLAYPVSMLFRLTRSGWEVGNRLGPFAFYGVALVAALAVAGYWQGRSRHPLRAAAVGLVGAILVLGGIISAEGPRVLVPAHHRVSADAASVEPLGIAAAEWTRDWLGRDRVFVADRINRLLLATYGRQQVATTLQDPRDTSLAILSPRLGPGETAVLREVGVDYVLTDLRLTTALPGVGVYFDGGVGDRGHAAPLLPASLLKFNADPTVGRVFDNGYLMIFDVRGLVDAP